MTIGRSVLVAEVILIVTTRATTVLKDNVVGIAFVLSMQIQMPHLQRLYLDKISV